MNNELVLPMKYASNSNWYSEYYANYDIREEKWEKEGYKNFKNDDEWFARMLSEGMTEVNEWLYWTCVFSDLHQKLINDFYLAMNESLNRANVDGKAFDGEYIKYSNKSDYFKYASTGYRNTEETEFQNKHYGYDEFLYSMKKIIMGDLLLARSKRKQEWWNPYLRKIYDENVEKIANDAPIIYLGTSESRDYASLYGVSRTILLNYFWYRDPDKPVVRRYSWMDEKDQERKKIKKREIETIWKKYDNLVEKAEKEFFEEIGSGITKTWLKRNMKKYISWIVLSGNEAQKYASYARGQPTKAMIKAFYAHDWSDIALETIMESYSCKLFYEATTSGIDVNNVKETEKECPV